MKSTYDYVTVRVPDRLIVDGDLYCWLEETFGFPSDEYYWRDLPNGHHISIRPEGMTLFRLKFKL